jgi:hypothetical protein
MTETAAVLFCLLALLVGAFQFALVVGAPWGEFTLGGRWKGSLPAHVRGLSLLSLLLLAVFAAVVVARAGLAFTEFLPHATKLAWCVVAYCAVGVAANAATPSRRERAVWLPVVLCMFVLSILVAAS